jgi:DNA-binding IclR family transcriptional regulator
VAARIQTIHRAAAVLRLLAGSRPLALAELSRKLQLSKPTTFGILRTMRAEGLIEQDLDSRRYRLGPALLVMGASYRTQSALLAQARHSAERLAAGLEQSVRLATLYDGHVLVLHHVPSGGDDDHHSDIGSLLPVGSTALGRVLVSERPELIPSYLNGRQGRTTEAEQLLGELETITAQGWTWRTRDPAPWQDSLAAPIRDHRGDIVAAIAISGRSDHLTDDQGAPRQTLVYKLISAAGAVSRAMETQAG